MKKRPRRVPWQWTGSDLVHDDEEVQLWLCPDLPPVRERSNHPLAIHISYWSSTLPAYAALPSLNAALFAFWRAFGHDSVLAAIRRQEPFDQVLMYTAAPKGVADRRYDDIHQALRPLSMGIRFAREPSWDALEQMLSSLSSGARR
jgi:hypothetical protein